MDIRTMIIILAVLTACSALVIIFIHKLHFSVQGTLYWACGLVTIACSLILLALEGILPDFITIVFADTAIVYGFSIVLSSMRIFVGRTSRLKITLKFSSACMAAASTRGQAWALRSAARLSTVIKEILPQKAALGRGQCLLSLCR